MAKVLRAIRNYQQNDFVSKHVDHNLGRRHTFPSNSTNPNFEAILAEKQTTKLQDVITKKS